MKKGKKSRRKNKPDRPVELAVGLDGLNLEIEQGVSGLPLVRIDFYRGGKRVTAHLSLFQHELRRDPTLRLTVVNRGRDVSRTVQICPWSENVGFYLGA